MALQYDIIVFGGGIAGLWTASRLLREGYNVILFERDALGAGQTLASQGMIHGGQKYTLAGAATAHAFSVAEMPARWEACFGGWGDIDLTAVKFLSDTQVMWPAGSVLSDAAVFAAAKLVNSGTEKLKAPHYPEALRGIKKFKGPVYEMPEKVLEVKSLLQALSSTLKGRIFKGEAEEILPDGQVAVGGQAFQAQAIVFAAGTGNETALKLLNLKEKITQRRPLRQIMVKTLDEPLYGHGIVSSPKPRLTVTAHPVAGGYVWYLGGNVAEKGAEMDDDAAIAFAKKELSDVFPHIDWDAKEWATWAGDRAEPFFEDGHLPPGPYVHQRGKILFAWPSKLTFAPALADRILGWLKEKEIAPEVKTAPPEFPSVMVAPYPWETAQWKKAEPA